MKSGKQILVVIIILGTAFLSVAIWQLAQNRASESSSSESPEGVIETPTDAVTAAGLTIITLSYEVKPNPPYYLGSGTSIDWDKPGVVVEVFKSLENRLDVEVRFIRNPWERGLKLLEANEVEGVFNASFRPERMELGVYPMKEREADPSKRTFTNAYFLYKLKNSPLAWDGEKFSHLDGEIGAVLGYAIVGDLKEMGAAVYEGQNQVDNLRKLVRGRLAGVAGLETMNDLYLETHPEEFKDIVKAQPPLAEKEYYLILSHQFVQQHPQLAADIWDEIERIRESGEFDKIAEKYLQ
jgi:polar amino acid transport system substrate-binding protein